ncbi:UNVERIFIED_CONTAM: hypothetical protein HDU68_005498 [Siphonaria sp. JEL0065]|nr:hypothetical protein HDU68_005498 [Siphonaria sp. JEL0065]
MGSSGKVVKPPPSRQRAISLSEHHYRGSGISSTAVIPSSGGVPTVPGPSGHNSNIYGNVLGNGRIDTGGVLMMKEIHPYQAGKPVRCPMKDCFKSYKNKGGLKYHLEHKHPEYVDGDDEE